MRLVDAAKPMFARHETFHPRYGWFRKAYSHVDADPHVFSREDAPVRVGVGKNMVRAIRFWGLAAKVIDVDRRSSNYRTSGLAPTCLGHSLFGESGWDRYMEDPGTLWLLHWLLLAPRSRLPVWWLTFNEFGAVEFTERELTDAVSMQLETSTWTVPHRSSIRKDVTALLRTYAPQERSRRGNMDDVLDCPLRNLNLIGRAEATDRLRFAVGVKGSLPPAIVAFAALDWVARRSTGGTTVALSSLATEPGSVGHAFKMNETELLTALEPIVRSTEGLALATPNGAVQLSWSIPTADAAVLLLNDYYGSDAADSSGLRAGYDGDGPISDELLKQLGLGRDPDDTLRRLHSRDITGAATPAAESHRPVSSFPVQVAH